MKKIYTLMALLVLTFGVTYANADCQVVTIFSGDGTQDTVVVCTD